MKSRRKPLILIGPSTARKGVEFSDVSVNLSECYPRAVIAAQGLPWLMSCTPSLDYLAESVSRADGVMLTGGEDVQPGLYLKRVPGKLRRTTGPHEPERDLVETMLIAEVFRQRKPLLAICRGHQLLNVALGGTLLVDIPTQRPGTLRHKRYDLKNAPVHPVRLVEGSLISDIFRRQSIRVNSTHHQAIDRLAGPLRATGLSPDGIIEATELEPDQAGSLPWFLSVQFHPERLVVHYPEFLALFRAFIGAAAAT